MSNVPFPEGNTPKYYSGSCNVDLDCRSVTSLEGGKVEGLTEEEIRASSAHSRASLREQYKAKLEEAKTAAEDRRSKSPAINLPTHLTVDDELILDDDEDEEGDDYFLEEGEMPIPDDLK
ncbi:Dpy-19-like protein 3, partial [Elysia marginata]